MYDRYWQPDPALRAVRRADPPRRAGAAGGVVEGPASSRGARVRSGDTGGGSARMAMDVAEGVGRDNTWMLVRDGMGSLEVFVANTMGLAESAEVVRKLSQEWCVAHKRI